MSFIPGENQNLFEIFLCKSLMSLDQFNVSLLSKSISVVQFDLV